MHSGLSIWSSVVVSAGQFKLVQRLQQPSAFSTLSTCLFDGESMFACLPEGLKALNLRYLGRSFHRHLLLSHECLQIGRGRWRRP